MINKRGERIDAARKPEYRRYVEGREAHCRNVDDRPQQSWPQHPQSDPQHHPPRLRTAHRRSLFERRVHRSHDAGDHDEGERSEAQSFDAAHAGNRRNIEWSLAEAEEGDKAFVDETDRRTEEEYPTECD